MACACMSVMQELFRPFGHVSRVFLAVDRTTGENRGFAFVNYAHKCVGLVNARLWLTLGRLMVDIRVDRT